MQWFSKTSKYFAILHAIIRKVGPTKESPINGFSSSLFLFLLKTLPSWDTVLHQCSKTWGFYVETPKRETFLFKKVELFKPSVKDLTKIPKSEAL